VKNNNSVLLELYAQAKVYTKSVDFNLSIYKLDLINAELEVFKNSKPICLLIIMHRIL
jgi:hypothetical protein